MTRTPDKAAPAPAPAAAPEETAATEATGRSFSDRAAGLADLVREHPKTAMAAGAAVAAGVAAAIPLARRSWGNGAATTSSGGKSGGGKAKKG